MTSMHKDYIQIEWMRKELYEMMYRRQIDYDTLKVYIDLLAKWRRKCEEDGTN